MAIKETPTNIKTYYKSMVTKMTDRKDNAIKERNKLTIQLKELYNDIKKDYEIYKDKFKVDLNDYKEFVDNLYINGEFIKVAKGLFINRDNNYELVADLHNLYKFATMQKQWHDLNKDIIKYDTLANLSLTKYTDLLRAFYTEVHKQIIIKGNGYAFSGTIGWICVNRCLIKSSRKIIDYAATKKREQELLDQGKRIYNKEEAEWCQRNGITYEAKDKRVFKTNEYAYEIPLIGCKLPNGGKYKLKISDYRHKCLRGKTNDDIIKECNKDINKICELSLDLKTKVTLCDKANTILYTKFIRNENQEPLAFAKAYSKNR